MPFKDPTSAHAREVSRRIAKKWREAHPIRAKEIRKKHYDAHAEEIRAASLKWHYTHRKESLERMRRSHLKRLYGLTPEQYDALGSVCRICGVKRGKQRLAVDHIEGTTIVRGLLCGKCNKGLGLLNHDPDLIRKAIEYLQRHAEKHP